MKAKTCWWGIGLLAAAPAWAASIYLNGTRVDGLTNQKFDKATVTIDAQGDVHIDAPGYTVQKAAATPADKPAPAGPTKRFWLVKEENYPGKTQYDVDIYINSVWYKRVRSNEEPLVQEITKALRSGPNVLHFAATKSIGGERRSFSPQVYLRIIVGEGDVGGSNIMIEKPIIQYKRTAEETQNYNDEFNLVAP